MRKEKSKQEKRKFRKVQEKFNFDAILFSTILTVKISKMFSNYFIFLVISKKKAPKTALKILFVIENFALDEKVFSGMLNALGFSVRYLQWLPAVSPPLSIKFML